MQIKELLKAILLTFYEQYSKWPSKTRLIKLLYLVELFYTRKYRKRILADEWIYYLYGPYIINYGEIISDPVFNVKSFDYGEGKSGSLVELETKSISIEITFDLKRVIKNTVSDFGSLDLKDLLNFVYFETEPMINAENRCEILDFSTVLPEDHYKIKALSLDKKTENKIRQEFREKVKRIKDAKRL